MTNGAGNGPLRSVSAADLRDVRARINADLRFGRDAWPAVEWLAETRDDDAKRTIIRELVSVLAGTSDALLTHPGAVNNATADVVFGRAAVERRRMGKAFDFAQALRSSMHHRSEQHLADPHFERTVTRRRRAAAEHEARTNELQQLGVEPGKGLPFWEMYMRRRRKKSWG